jgi:hypothetical protein
MTLLAGTAIENIVPPERVGTTYMAGYNSFCAPAVSGVHDPLYARALVLDDGVARWALVSLDLIGLSYPDVLEMKKTLSQKGFPGENLLVFATHTHAGPDVIGLWGPRKGVPGVNLAYLTFLKERVVATVLAAFENLQPVKMVAAAGSYPRAVVNNRQPGFVNDTIGLIALKGKAGFVASLATYTLQVELTTRDNNLLSADFPAVVCQAVEENLGGVCLYASGIDGGMTPYRPEAGFGEVLRVGQEVSAEVLKLAELLVPVEASPISLQRKIVRLPIENPLFQYLGDGGFIRRKAEAGCLETEIDRLDIGRLTLITIPGEPFPGIVAGLPAAPSVFYLSQANDFLGYFMTPQEFDPQRPTWTTGFFTGHEGESLGLQAGCLVRETVGKLVKVK